MLIGLTGPSATGKGTICNILDRHFGAKTLSTSRALRSILEQRGIPQTREHLQNLAQEIHTQQGPAALMEMLMTGVTADGLYVIDSLRYLAQAAWLAQQPHAVLIGVKAHFCLRLVRLRARDRDSGDTDLSVIELQTQDAHPVEVEIPQLLEIAAHVFVNDGTITTLEADVVAYVQQLLQAQSANGRAQ